MLTNQPWMKCINSLEIEITQSEEEGRIVSNELKAAAAAIAKMPQTDANASKTAEQLFDTLQALPVRDDFTYCEPDTLQEIKEQRPREYNIEKKKFTSEELYNKIYGAWLGRCGGCLLGQPVEGWYSKRITGLLKDSGNWPVKSYISSQLPEEIRKRYDVTDIGGPYGAKLKGWINNVPYMPEDDDINYTVLALKLVEDYGFGFTPMDVSECWLNCLPLLHTCTAERVAYINLANFVPAPDSAKKYNPYREWIGAQIRGDVFGYINPCNPEAAAEMAWRDASISHVKNGIYGEMFVAAMLSAAFVLEKPVDVVKAGLAQIPSNSRLAEKINEVLAWFLNGVSKEDALLKIHEQFDEKKHHDWTHTISNAMIVTIGLVYGNLDYTASIALGTISGFDTDCNAATIGSIVGLVLGAQKLPEQWISPLNNTLKSGVDGFGVVKISDMAQRTAALCR